MVSDEELERAYFKMARIIERYGEKYLPIFERLEKELNERKAKNSLMQRALEAAKSKN